MSESKPNDKAEERKVSEASDGFLVQKQLAEDDHDNYAQRLTAKQRKREREREANAALEIAKKQRRCCIPWSERAILFQLFWGVAVLFFTFSVVYMGYLYLAIVRFQHHLISEVNSVIDSEGHHKFEIIMDGTVNMVKDHFNLTE